MGILSWIFIFSICGIMVWSLIQFIRGGKYRLNLQLRESKFSAEIFYTLVIVYFTVIIGFGLIYFILSINRILLVENGELREVSIIASMIHSIYFSGVTLLTIGYGDITPIGIGRLIALIQALIGYILPTAFVLRIVQSNQENRDE
ncbi:potassium channel family protein [Virgibacillus ihumii]|uniref:potassium channel family protein n=1 Tax=Virgibacillus ihumii TaxID=2686091 RepID=UPI00157BE81D|nr:potassium channel family protein [Virgibacillus ihumii]